MSKSTTSDLKSAFQYLTYFGHVPKENEALKKRLENLAPTPTEDALNPDYVRHTLLECLQKGVAGIPANSKVLIPISGGNDSRVVLGGALELERSFEIVTMTCGMPGAMDSVRGPIIARKLGLPNRFIDLSDVFVLKNLFDAAAKLHSAGHRIAPFRPASYWQSFRDFNDISLCLSGLMGDVTGGSRTKKGYEQPQRALEDFIKSNIRLENTQVLHHSFDPRQGLPSIEFLASLRFPADNYLDYMYRQAAFTRNVVCPPQIKMYSPFATDEWMSLTWGVPRNLRSIRRIWYLDMMHKIFPELFGPIKESPIARLKRLTRPLRTKIGLVHRQPNKWGSWDKTMLGDSHPTFVQLAEQAFATGIALGALDENAAELSLKDFKNGTLADNTVELVIGAYLMHDPALFPSIKQQFGF